MLITHAMGNVLVSRDQPAMQVQLSIMEMVTFVNHSMKPAPGPFVVVALPLMFGRPHLSCRMRETAKVIAVRKLRVALQPKFEVSQT